MNTLISPQKFSAYEIITEKGEKLAGHCMLYAKKPFTGRIEFHNKKDKM
jgi:hypothetical protein